MQPRLLIESIMSSPQSSASRWPDAPSRPAFATMETATLAFWRDHDVFQQSMRQNASAPVWTFYEGPPTANGMPGTHHVEARVFKDVFPRYRTMKGFYVRRKAGWDCHGLPVELEVERELGLNSKTQIEAYGIEAFNAKCRESVQRYVGAFEELTERIGFWIDTNDAYRTMDPAYIDSLWWALKTLWEKDLIFEDHRVAPYCGRCGTGLSDAEVALGYQEVDDPSVYVRFPVTAGEHAGASLVVWTTTPWTLLSNTACAVGADITYALIETSAFGQADERLILAADRIAAVIGEADFTTLATFSGESLTGMTYTAPYTIVEVDVAYRYVTTATFVTTTDGSGIVHMAPAFGADDMAIGRREGLPVINPVDAEAKFATGPFAGIFVRDADQGIIADLQTKGVLLRHVTYRHTYPFCWRCKNALIYRAKPSWYIRTTAVRDDLIANNQTIDWHPEHIREGRFGNWLENNVDWALSRDRYWGTPLPFWRCTQCTSITVVASRAELGELAGIDLDLFDPHRPFVDDIAVPCSQCGSEARRVPDVADAWFDSGAMPFAQWGYPHQNTALFQQHYPADYICEAIDQTRGWFYTLLAESTLLFGDSAYQTCLCLGHIVDEDGRKMSKSLGNILDPFELIGRHGADALRWLMFAEGNPWVSRRVGHHNLDEVTRRFLLTIWNTHVFFLTYANIDGFDPQGPLPAVADRPRIDQWVLAELARLVDTVDTALEGYDVSTATRALERFVDDLSNWYVRRNRRRFWKSVLDDPVDKRAAYATLHTCLTTLSTLLAPFVPFIAERLWQDLVVTPKADPNAAVSVHLASFPSVPDDWRNDELVEAMATARRIVELGRQARNDSGVKIRQPLARALVSVPSDERSHVTAFADDIADELNIITVALNDQDSAFVERSFKPQFKALGPVFGKDAPVVARALSALDPATVDAALASMDTTGSADVPCDGGTVTVTIAMVEVVESPLTGWAVAQSGATSFALDTALDRELIVAGATREIVRAVNDARKARGLALADRIDLNVTTTPSAFRDELLSTVHRDALARDVLAVAIGDTHDGDIIDVAIDDLGAIHLSFRVVHS